MRKSISEIRRFGQVSLALFVLISAFAFIPVFPIYADPITLYLTPLDAAVGDTVTVAGYGATINGEVKLYLGRLVLASTIADEMGTYSTLITVPPVPRGSQTIIVLDVGSGDTTIASLTVEPRILVTPAVGSFNDRISVRGEGFAAHEYITLWLEGVAMILPSTPTTDFLGAFETSFQVPSMPNGTYTFSAQDDDGNAAKTLITIAPKILTQPTSATPNTFVLIYGYGFSASAEFTLLFDSIDLTPYGTNMTSPEGFFITALFVPNVLSGIHSISAHDSMGNSANCPFATPSPIMMLNPNAISESTIVTIEGTGFKPDAPVELYLEDTITTSVYDLMATTEDIMPKADGSFQYSFMVPITRAGTYEVAAYEALGLLPSDLPKVASATLTVVEHASLDADITAGTMHFRGEIAEFYLKAALKGELIDVQIDRATIYSVSGSFEQDLRSNVTQISTGFYRIPCQIPDAASFGTYALLIEISLRTNLLEAYGSTTGSFMISPFFTMQVAQLLDIQNNIATIIIPELGTVKANLSTINAKLGSIEGNVAFIQSDIGTLRTSTEAIHATVTSIEDDVATIWSDVGTIRVKMTESGNQINVAALFAVAAAIVSSASAAILYRRKPPKPPTATSASPPEEGPPPQSAPAPTQPEEQERTQTQNETPAEAPKPAETPPQETQPSVEPPPQTQSPPESTTPKEPSTQPQSEPQPQPQTIVVQPEQPVPQ